MIIRISILPMAIAFLLAGCVSGQKSEPGWGATKIRMVEGFRIPECVVVDDATDRMYVSNIDLTYGPNEYDSVHTISLIDLSE